MKEETTQFLTTQQLARLWHVSQATIKRWADAGHLRPGKTLGGHRRFALSEIARFQRERGLGANAEASKMSRARALKSALKAADAGAAHERFFEALAEGAEDAATNILLKLYLDKIPLAKILDETLAGAMHRIGELWHGGEMTVADEHLASRTAMRSLEALGQLLRPEQTNGRTAICCAVEEELHDIPVLCVQILLESEGWTIRNFGANTPLFALAITIEKHCPELVCLSSSVNVALDRNVRDYPQVREAAQGCGARIALGGEGFRDTAVRDRFPADFYAENFSRLLEFAQEVQEQR
ncbi:MAG: MerR family transcriptional regulator, light-induced transcriptional regulator [Blastocatellia bacterium]|jgi:excisionase family DNA binding protein|nr:MerR family transcriptional regulator, light-induced transcriptional regulator [Blastocatellia bacterium]